MALSWATIKCPVSTREISNMAATFQHDCPHCRTRSCLFTATACSTNERYTDKIYVDAIFRCANCGSQIFVSYSTTHANYENVHFIPGAIYLDPLVKIRGVLPQVNPVDVPEHIPDRVAELFKEAEDNRADKRLESASASYRKALELALKVHTPDVEAFKLEKRIDKLFSQGKITESLKDWAHDVRLIGNDGLHDLEKPEVHEVEQMALLTKYLLIYLYTLPEKVRISRQ